MADLTHSELGDFLRSRRERLSPEALGVPTRRRRRTPGLRREEVAELAGIGIDWYVRLEQGRAVSPSVTTIDALARALRLGNAEHAHLRALARNASRRNFVRETVPEAIRRLVDSLAQPAYVTGRRWDILAWNPAANEIFGIDGLAEEDRNILILMLTVPGAKRLFGDSWADEAKQVVGKFRATHDLWADDPAFVALLERLRQHSPEFSAWWEPHDIHEPSAGRKCLQHPTRGTLAFEYVTFQSNDDPALRITIYTPV